MHDLRRHIRRWPTALGRVARLGVVAAISIAAAPAATAEGVPAPSTPQLTLSAAHRAVVESDRRVATTTAARDRARERLAALDQRAAALVNDLAETRAELRRRAVGAYVSSGADEPMLVLFGSADVFEASARVHALSSSARASARTMARYQRLRDDADPRLVRLGIQLQRLEQDVADANDAALAARANEAEAEREQAARAAAAALARAAATTTTTVPAALEPARVRADSVATADATAAAVATPATPAASAAPAPTAPTPVPAPAPSAPLPAVPAGGPSEAQWAKLRACESGGNYRAVSASGKYRGAYQFDYRTWAGLGGAGDPAAAPPAEQDARAKLLYSQRGWRPWPVCGRYLQ
ncbi:MAG: transglycosylase family protein [Acidimicrobiales bacterium]